MNSRQETPIDLDRWCRYIVKVGHVTATLIILAHVIWYFAARSVLAWPTDIYLRNYIILPAMGFFALNLLVDMFVRSASFSLPAKEYLSLSLFIIFSLYLSLTHDIAKVLLCSYILPIFSSTIFSNVKLTRWIFFTSVISVLLLGVKIYFAGELNSSVLMEIFVACFMFLCSYLLAKVLIQYGHDNLAALVNANKEAMNTELAFLQAQIKPHFLYNTINTMVSFCYTDSEKAANLLVNFSKYLRLTFDIDHKLMLVPLEREIELIKTYVDVEKARFGEIINVEYDIDPKLLSMEIPSFCIQPLVENAIKHGLLKKDSGGTVYVAVKKSEEAVIIKVSDTGIGMSAEKLDKLINLETVSEGVGFFNVIRRIKGWRDTQIDIQSAEGRGTTVSFNIPVRYS
ncbi:sensor histidine kinase [Ruminiclostridium cellobioparum]|uniref:Signal transduction histidine kinase LytS n=1 Tax=Ruminiclostridium cellobioparum subsp. termitidis CT1112 TaxID=1195236 RepID=S0FUD6_RUMCE|nr:histidine kinase [Ruminiclostridium cellobioparum]EMS73936.1 signal transduction histidine kinase LytS [Ruminiclostridium cellobioparum subsp. termitidis CT1112]